MPDVRFADFVWTWRILVDCELLPVLHDSVNDKLFYCDETLNQRTTLSIDEILPAFCMHATTMVFTFQECCYKWGSYGLAALANYCKPLQGVSG